MVKLTSHQAAYLRHVARLCGRKQGECADSRAVATALGATEDERMDIEDALAHDAGRFDEIGKRAVHVALPDGDEPALTNLRVALRFSARWTDAMTGGQQPISGVTKAEWPRRARRIASDLSADREISAVHVPVTP